MPLLAPIACSRDHDFMSRTSALLDPLHEVADIGADRLGNVEELDRIDASFAILEFRNIGLRLSEPIRQFLLRHARPPPLFGEQLPEGDVAWVKSRPWHRSATL